MMIPPLPHQHLQQAQLFQHPVENCLPDHSGEFTYRVQSPGLWSSVAKTNILVVPQEEVAEIWTKFHGRPISRGSCFYPASRMKLATHKSLTMPTSHHLSKRGPSL